MLKMVIDTCLELPWQRTRPLFHFDAFMAPKIVEIKNKINDILNSDFVQTFPRINTPPHLPEVERFNAVNTANIEEIVVSSADGLFTPLERNLRALLIQATGNDNLEQVTVVKLRVISREVPLQHLSFHIPSLRELILDGSSVSSLRDLGNLRNLNVLRVNRCGLVNLDGLSSFECLEELYAAENLIENLTQCAFLANVKVIDFRRCRLKNLLHTLPFLTMCENITRIHLEGNDEIWQFPKYRRVVKSLLPALRSLDGITFTSDDDNSESSSLEEIHEHLQINDKFASSDDSQTDSNPVSPSKPQLSTNATNFTVTFPPKVFQAKPSSPK